MGRKKKDQAEEVDTPIPEFTEIWSGRVPPERIQVEMSLQVRQSGVNLQVVDEYSKVLEEEDEDLPAVDVFTTADAFNPDCALLLSDGFHRLTGYKRLNRPTIPVRVFHGDNTDAFTHAIFVNGQHGLAFTPKDRVYVVRMILANPDTKDWSVRRIASLVGCSKSTVANIKTPPAPKPVKKREPKPDAEAPQEPQVVVEGLSNIGQVEPERYAPDAPVGAPLSDGPAVQSAVVRERQEPTLPTKNERLVQLAEWIKEGHITRADVQNLFSNGTGNFVFLRSDMPTGKKTLIIRSGGVTLIEAEVTVNAELQALIDVSVDDPRLVEFVAEEDILSAV
jgi:hypothetical protein